MRNFLNQNDGSTSPTMIDTPIVEEVKKEHVSQASLLRRKIFERKKNKRDDVITPKSLPQLTSLWQERLPKATVIGLCAQNGTGIDGLLDKIVSYLPQVVHELLIKKYSSNQSGERFILAEFTLFFLC